MIYILKCLLTILLLSLSIEALSQEPDTLGEDFASELSGYGELAGRVPDTMVNAVVYSHPFAVFTRSFALFLFGIIFLFYLSITLFKATVDKGRSLGILLITTILAFIFLKPTTSDFKLYTQDGEKFASLEGHAVGAAYPLKAVSTVLYTLNSGLERFLSTNNFEDVASEQVYNFVNRHHLKDFSENNKGVDQYLLTPLQEYYDRCTPIAHAAAKNQGAGNITTEDFIALGLLGGTSIGEGFTFNRPADSSKGDNYNLNDLKSDRTYTTVNNQFRVFFNNDKDWYQKRERASRYLYENGRINNPDKDEVLVPIKSHGAWLDVLSNNLPSTGEQAIIPAVSSPFASDVTRPVYEDPSKYTSGGNNKLLETAAKNSTNNSSFVINNCWSAYVAAETALTHYFDAVYDNNSSRKPWYNPTKYSSPRNEIRKNAGPVTAKPAWNAVSTFTVMDSQNQLLGFMRTGEMDGSNLTDKLRNGIHKLMTSFKEFTYPFTIMGLCSLLIMGFVAIYVMTPLLFVFSLMIPDLLPLCFKLMLFLLLSTIMSIVMFNLGALLLYQVLWSFYQNNLGNFGAPDINTSLLYVSVYNGLLIVMASTIFAFAYFIIWKDVAGLKRLNADGAGLATALGGATLTLGSLALGFATRSLGFGSNTLNSNNKGSDNNLNLLDHSLKNEIPSNPVPPHANGNTNTVPNLPSPGKSPTTSDKPSKPDPFDFTRS